MSNAVAVTAITAGGVTRMELFGGRRNMSYVLMDLIPDSKVDGANMGPVWGRQDPGGPHVGPMNFAAMYLGYYHKTSKLLYFLFTIVVSYIHIISVLTIETILIKLHFVDNIALIRVQNIVGTAFRLIIYNPQY